MRLYPTRLIALFSFFILFNSLFALEEEQLVWEDSGPTAQEYHAILQRAIATENWWAAIDYADLILYNFPTSPFAEELSFTMGEADYKLNHLEYANQCFTSYLNHTNSPKYFEEAILYKFQIAEHFANGTKKRLFGSIKMPAWVPAEEDAIAIFDEVISALPHSDFAVQAMSK